MASHLPVRAFVGIGLAVLFVLLLLLFVLLRSQRRSRRKTFRSDDWGYSDPEMQTAGAWHEGRPGLRPELPAELPAELLLTAGFSESQTVNPRDVWKPTDLERFASPVAEMLRPPVILQEAQKWTTSIDESSTHHDTEISVLGSSFEATNEEPTTDSQKGIVENLGLAKILPAHIKDRKNEETLSVMSSEQQSTIPKIVCTVTGCTRTFNKQYELNHHMRYHTKQNVCETCQASFGTVTHLNRHINSVHQTAKVYHCTVAGCSYFKTANPPKSFSRKDNWRRHMIEQHGSGQGDDLGVMDF